MAKIFVTTVQLVIKAEDEDMADSAVNGILSSYDMADGTLEDWNYLEVGSQHLTPTRSHTRFPDYLKAFHAGLSR